MCLLDILIESCHYGNETVGRRSLFASLATIEFLVIVYVMLLSQSSLMGFAFILKYAIIKLL